MSTTYKIAAAQIDVHLAQPEKNLAHIEEMLRETAWEGAHLTVFPECAVTGYCFDSLEEARPYAEPIPGPSTDRLADLCRELKTHAVVGLLEEAGDDVFNACVLIGPEGFIGGYRKVHLPFLGVDRYVSPGDRSFQVWPAGELRIGMNICYDSAFPEAARCMALDGVDLIVLPTNWPPAATCFAAHAIQTRAMENHVYYLAANRVGTERGVAFIGHSRICEPTGGTVAEATHEKEALCYAEIDPAIARQKRLVRVQGIHHIDRIQDRRPEMYGRLLDPVEKPA